MADQPLTQRVVVWRAIHDGDCALIHLSETGLWNDLKHEHWKYTPENHNEWTITSTEEIVPIIIGVAHDWESGGVHIHWDCPYCGEEHWCDRYEDKSPQLWFCSWDKGIALVKWTAIE